MAYSSTTETFLVGASPVRRPRRKQPGRARLPDLAPAEHAGSLAVSRQRLSDTVARLRAQFREVLADPEADNPVARALVYALNVVLMALAFPIGFAMLLFNVLGGENLRTTVHVLALTGMAAALANTEAGAGLLGLQ